MNLKEIYNQKIGIPMLERAAIWLSKPVHTSKGNTCRIAAGDYVNVSKGLLCNLEGAFSHKVICIKTSESDSIIELTLQPLTSSLDTPKILRVY